MRDRVREDLGSVMDHFQSLTQQAKGNPTEAIRIAVYVVVSLIFIFGLVQGFSEMYKLRTKGSKYDHKFLRKV